MTLVERADELMQYAEILLRDHQAIMRHDDRILAEDRMLNARHYRYGIEQKRWLAQAEQAKLYLERSQIALDTVKWAVENAIEIRSRRGGF
ncbi:hypothetical protein BGY98DRAFT_972907 [Russula aff. rugulosa BPL654]|nr:hypothetical protein BGY98DRAFT_972907 [Russula aff. rugulosa BPL654]